MANYEITYEFRFSDGIKKNYTFEIDNDTRLMVQKPDQKPPPDWAKLENKKCSHCPLKSDQTPYCPVAVNIAQPVDDFKEMISYSKVLVEVKTPQRNYSKIVSLQDGISSALGFAISCSACPHVEFLKAMSHFHLPFTTIEEVLSRATSIYLLKQYFVTKEKGQPDFSLQKLKGHYENLQKVDLGMLDRVREVSTGDADINAINTLASFSSLIASAISTDLTRIAPLFK